MQRAFSLVELAIVLVILGLLTGGILAGQSLIRAAELRAVVSEFQRYTTAVQSFRDRYMALPGDMANATRFWLRLSTTSCTTNSSAAVDATNGTCDGDGDGTMEVVAAASTSSELFQFWRQLALAGMIEGSYSGLSGASGATGFHAVLGTNVPSSRLNNAGWSVHNVNTGAAGVYFDAKYGNTFYFGTAASVNHLTGSSVLRPEELWSIDSKIDDGKPGRGSIIARNISTCTDAGSGAGSENDLDAEYLLTSTAIGCAIMTRNSF